MPFGVSSILQYKHFQSFRSQQILNVQYYIVLAMEVLSDDLSDYVQPIFDTWVGQLTENQSTGLTHVRGELYEVNGLDFGIYAPSVPSAGLLAGDSMPPFVAVKVQQVRASRATRHGWKRFAGLPEASASNGQLLPAVLTAWQDNMETLFDENQTFYSSEFPMTRNITLQPIIWGGNDPDFPLGRYSAIDDVVVSNETTSQVTRKIGRGA